MRKPKSITPADKIYTRDPLRTRFFGVFKQIASRSGQIFNACVVIGILMIISVVLGVIAYPIYRYLLAGRTVPQILDGLTMYHLSTVVVLGAVVACIVSLYVFYPSYLPDSAGKHSSDRRFTRLIASLIILFLIDIILFRVDFNDFNPFDPHLFTARLEFFVAQATTAIVMSLGLITFRNKIKIDRIERPQLSSPMMKTWHWGRFLLVSLAVIVFCRWLVIRFLLPSFGHYTVLQLTSPIQHDLRLPHFTATAVSLAVAALLFRPPEHSDIKNQATTLRLLLLVISIGSVVWAYRYFANFESYFFLVVFSVAITTMLAVVQRALS